MISISTYATVDQPEFVNEIPSETIDIYNNQWNDQKDEPVSLKYELYYDTSNEKPRLRVSLSLIGNSDGITTFSIPTAWAWQDNYELGIKNLHVENKDIEIIKGESENTFTLFHEASQLIELNYDVIQYWDGPINRDVYYRPMLTQTYYHFIGHGVFVYPKGEENDIRDITLVVSGVPKGWVTLNSYGIKTTSQMLRTTISEFCHSAYMSGDFRIQELNINGYPLFIAQRGCWEFDNDEFNSLVEAIVMAERKFWNDYSFPYFLICMLPIDSEKSIGGTGLTNSFEMFISTDYTDLNALKFLLAHELFHTWNGRKIQRIQPEELVYWFSEGFTNYYARLILLRNELITLEQFISDYNRSIINYFSSTAKNISNVEILKFTHNDNQIENIPYLRGDLIAFRWNRLIKDSSDNIFSLDNLMFDLLRSALDSNMLVSHNNINLLFHNYLKDGVMDDINELIEKGKTITPGPNDLGPCVELNEIEYTPFDLGFTYTPIENTKHWIIEKVDSTGPAFHAGLEKGQKVIGKSIYWNNIDKQIKLKIENTNNEAIWHSYYPHGTKIYIPQYNLNQKLFMENPNRCLSWFN